MAVLAAFPRRALILFRFGIARTRIPTVGMGFVLKKIFVHVGSFHLIKDLTTC